jgi:hypothetical protein
MKVLSKDEIAGVGAALAASGGAGTDYTKFGWTTIYDFSAPANCTVSVAGNANGSTTISATCGERTAVWNSGVALSCFAFGAGAGLMSLAFTGGNLPAAALIDVLATVGCNYVARRRIPDGN